MIPIISISSGEAVEGEFVAFTVTLSEADPFNTVSATFRTVQDGTASENIDNDRVFDTVEFSPGETVQTIFIDSDAIFTQSDTVNESDENFTLELFNPVNGILAGGQPTLSATGVILDNDGTDNDRALFVSDPQILEGDDGTTQAVFEVRISEPSTSTLNFAYTTANGTAIAGEDFVGRSGNLEFSPNETVQFVIIDLLPDDDVEIAETFSLVVTPNGAIANEVDDAGGVATIIDDDASTDLPVISISSGEAVEGELVAFTVTLSEVDLFNTVSATFRTVQDGAASEDIDNDRVFSTVEFLPGQTVRTIFIDSDALSSGSDNNNENDENFTLELFNPINGVLAGGQPTLTATGVILDNDGTDNDRALFVSDPQILEGDDGTIQAVFEVRISEPSTSTLNFAYTTANGTAIAGEDFVAQLGTVTFLPGQTVSSVIVIVNSDDDLETAENFSLVVTPNVQIAGTIDDTGVGTILNDDAAPITGTDDSETLDGTNDDDSLVGRAGNDIINGLAGDDTIDGGAGADTLDGGDGIDTLSYEGSAAGVIINLFNGVTRGGDAIGDTISNFENLTGSSNVDILRGDEGVNILTGNAGNDRLEGREGEDILNGGEGNDLLLGGSENDTINGDDGNDNINGQGGDDTLNGGDGTDRLLGAAGNDTLIAGEGENNVLDGGSGADILIGSSERDIIRGQASRDTITGGGGNDALTGGFGPDTFIFNANDGGDVINDFEDNFDTIDLSSLGTDFASLTLSVIGGDDALIDYGSGSIRLRDFDVNDLDTGDFDFV
ncbi:MAG: Calx-beta domain-containing protein [Hyphomicrobiales bacterium]